jgi:hypothetical protein
MYDDKPATNLRAVSVSETVRLAEQFPGVALHRLFLELSRAEREVPLGAPDRADKIAATIAMRLAATADQVNLGVPPG